MRLSELKENLPFTKRYRTENGINVFKCNLRELKENEAYDMALRYRHFIRDGLYLEIAYSFSGNDLNELLSEKRNASEIFDELRITEGISKEEFDRKVELKKQLSEDTYIVCTDNTLPSESKLLMADNYMTDNFKVRQLYDAFVKDIKFNEFDKLKSYRLSLSFDMPSIMVETLNNEFDDHGNLIKSVLNIFNTNTEITKCGYDKYGRIQCKKYILNDELIYIDNYRYKGNLRYRDMIMPDGEIEKHDITLMEDGYPLIQTSSSISSKYGSIEGIMTFDYVDDDVILESIHIVPSNFVEL